MEVKFHDIGEGMTEGEIVQFFVQVGEEVKVDAPLLEVQTDKMVAEIPSPAAGKVTAIHFDVGETVHVGSTIIDIDDGTRVGNSPPMRRKDKVHDAVAIEKDSTETGEKKKAGVLAAPYTRKIAREHQIDIENIMGTGKDGRVTENDVYQLLKRDKETIESTELSQTLPFKGIRKQIAKNMIHAVRTIPHVTHFEEIDVTTLMALRKEMKEDQIHVSIVAFFLKALAITLKEYPIFNATLDEEKAVIRLYEQMNIGLATDTQAGLLVPVLHHIEQKTIQQIHQEMKTLTKKAQDGKLNYADMSGGTFTISNVGPLGGLGATPIIHHPESAIMAFHKTKKMPVVMGDEEVKIRSIMNISLSFDHRIIDGADAVHFTNRFVALVEDPYKLLIELM
jgi:pyruvate dehydrogenase E2 component (dihydrolipoamide acetyltransferase)